VAAREGAQRTGPHARPARGLTGHHHVVAAAQRLGEPGRAVGRAGDVQPAPLQRGGQGGGLERVGLQQEDMEALGQD